MNDHNRALASSACALLSLSTAAFAAPGNRSGHAGPANSVVTKTGTGTTTGTTTTSNNGPGGHKGPGGFGGPGNGRPGHFSPFINGTLTSVDTTADTITVTAANGTVSIISIAANTNIVAHKTILASAIAVNDTLEVKGIPLDIQASGIVDNKLTSPSTTTSASTDSYSSSNVPSNTNGTPPVSGSLHVRGVVTVLSPLTIEVNNDPTFLITLTTTDATTFTELVSQTITDIANETGDTVQVRLTNGNSSTLTAAQVDITVP